MYLTKYSLNIGKLIVYMYINVMQFSVQIMEQMVLIVLKILGIVSKTAYQYNID